MLSPFLDVFQVFAPASGEQAADFAHLERHARLVAQLAQELAPQPLRALAYAAGLIHDVGRLVIMTRMPELGASLAREAESLGCGVEELEHRALGITHAEIGAYLLGLWGIPPELTIAAHHHHDLGPGRPGEELATALRVADWLALEHAARTHRGCRPRDPLLLDVDEPLLRSAGVQAKVYELLDLAEERAEVIGVG